MFIYEGDNKNIGFLKNKAFHMGTGFYLVEVDHDDKLMSDCLLELKKAFEGNPKIGFVYSNNAKLRAGGFTPYNPRFGWAYRTIKYDTMNLIEMKSFPADSGSIAYIWYCPDHVRAWRADVYKEIGGHNKDLSVCDDHELLIRTYLKTYFHHIDEPLYIYRITGDNEWLAQNKDIQNTTKSLCKEYLLRLAERDCEKKKLAKIDLGGGLNKKVGYTSIDIEGGDITHDLNKGIPLEDNSVGVINASHLIEHLHDKHKIIKEIHRVLCDGGWAFIEVPSTDGRGAFMDPTHVSYWNENSFWYYTRQDQARFIRNKDIRFQEYRLETGYPDKWWKDNNIPVVWAWLRAVKSDKCRPHTLDI